jgi:4-hydroxy-tetrahydrodipicolinate reductase
MITFSDVLQAEIEKVRDPSVQVARMGVPESHLGGHAFHTYR